ncbi:hypothetical protein P5V15_002482 [Pogonomyrmex californicus]
MRNIFCYIGILMFPFMDTWGSDYFPIVLQMDIEVMRYIRRTNKITTRKTRMTGKANPVKWWDQECEEVIKYRRKAQKRFIKEQTTHAFIEYKRCRAITRRMIRSKKKEAFKDFLR